MQHQHETPQSHPHKNCSAPQLYGVPPGVILMNSAASHRCAPCVQLSRLGRRHTASQASATPPPAFIAFMANRALSRSTSPSPHLVSLLNCCALNADFPLAVTLLLLEGAWADLARQDLGPDVVLLGKAQPDLERGAAVGTRVKLTSCSRSGTGQVCCSMVL